MTTSRNKVRGAVARWIVAGAALTALTGCAEGQGPAFLSQQGAQSGEAVSRAARAVERDVEAPEIFQATEAGLWDGRPSLGGVWVAHPEVDEPGRVIIRNEQNGKFVIGALFRRERETPGPRLQVSSDAATALGMLAGQPTNLNVVALTRQEVPSDGDPVPGGTPIAVDVPEATDVETAALDPVAGAAAAALDNAAAATAPRDTAVDAAVPSQPASTSPAPAPTPQRSQLDKPYIQVGIFSIEQNARNTATAMRQAGMVPTVKQQSLSGKRYWRVVVGPAQTAGERATLLDTIKDTGFTDAYAVDS